MAKHRVLLVEDEDIIAMLTEEMLSELGYEVTVSAASLEAGLQAVSDGGFDVAVLDINLRGETSFPIADILAERNMPFIFASGYIRQGFEPRFAKVPSLQKPFTMAALSQTLSQALADRRPD
jgi:CheY-like chemotaxis protein